MGKVKTVLELVSDCRSLLDEENNTAIDTQNDILPALNRAQDYASNILARHYESPLITYKEVTLTANRQEFPLPEDAFEERIEKVEVSHAGGFYPVTRLSYRDITNFESSATSSIPQYYAVINNNIRLVPNITGVYPLRVWYLKDPLPLVLPQGRITKVDEAGEFILVDAVGTSLTTENDNLNSYVNIIDGQSGAVKATLQIKNIVDNKIVFKTIPSRLLVYNQTISTTIVGAEIEQDDFICTAEGACIPYLKKPMSNFLIQYAVSELTRKLGGETGVEQAVLKQLEDQVERSWVGRESTLRVKMVNNKWSKLRRRFWR